MKTKAILRTLLTTSFVGAAFASATPASADEKPSAKSVVKKMVKPDNLKVTAGGAKVVQSGPAKPVENWFGCKPAKTASAATSTTKPKNCK